MKLSQSNFNLRSPDCIWFGSYLIATLIFDLHSLPWNQISYSFYFVDLTATDRYYNPNMLPSTIRHTKIKTKGHVVPDYHVVQR